MIGSHLLPGWMEEHWAGVQTGLATQGQVGNGNGGGGPLGVEAPEGMAITHTPLIAASESLIQA